METHEENIIKLRNIRSLSGLNFYIPDYQRGYRWTRTQAIEMLNDFSDFIQSGKDSNKATEGFYCLQPVVVKPRQWTDNDGNTMDGYEVIDGQQRLTTLYLLLTALFCKDLRNKDDVPGFEMFTLYYKTREDSREFLLNIGDATYRANKAFDCIDFYHINMVFDAFMSELVSERRIGHDRSLVKLILDEEWDTDNEAEEEDDDSNKVLKDYAHNVRVLWYEIGSEEKATAEDIFTRLNIGKIPLTNAELIKAMFLKESNFGKITAKTDKEQKAQQLGIALQQNKIAEEWNEIEQKLQREDFWYFLGAGVGKEYETRIEFVFDLMAEWNRDKETYHTFNHFLGRIKQAGNKKAAENVWKTVKDYFRELEYWYNDRLLYHLIGFLIENGRTIHDIMSLRIKTVKDETGHEVSFKLKKDEFHEAVHKDVANTMNGVDLDNLTYPDADITKVLLLFNVLSVIENQHSDIKFPFDRYKKECWDKEHIASQTDKDRAEVPKDNSSRIEWIDDMLYYFTGIRDSDAVDHGGNKLNKQEDRNDWLVNRVNEYIDIERRNAERIVDEDHRRERTSELDMLSELLEAKKMSLMTSRQRSSLNQTYSYDDLMQLLFRSTRVYFDEDRLDEADKDSLGNMALLNASINRGYGNAYFAIKRMHIQDNDSEGVFIPLTTKNVFMKYYSKRVDSMLVWTNDDAKAYLNAIKRKLSRYLNS